ncbi:MAG: NADH-quinone oxidoreductase subunit K [Coriobacteriia bacterium]|nr:NADH-quinone oxidoreductase subunit K [Coriobacteriia bacterium]
MLTKLFIVALVLTATAGIYSIVATRNLLRVLIAMEIISKAAVLLLMLAGAINGQMAQAEAFAVALIIIEAVVTAIGAVLCIALHAKTGSLDIGLLGKAAQAILPTAAQATPAVLPTQATPAEEGAHNAE